MDWWRIVDFRFQIADLKIGKLGKTGEEGRKGCPPEADPRHPHNWLFVGGLAPLAEIVG